MSLAADRPRILFRCDASREIGGGHVMRCLALADRLASDGAEATFACSRETSETVPALVNSNHEMVLLNDPFDGSELAQSGRIWDAAVVDHYLIDAGYERELRIAAPVIVAIDDLADRPHDCDILVDQNLGRVAAAYQGLVPPRATLCLGPDFALLRPEFARARQAVLARRRRQASARRIFVSLGMTDVGGITARVVYAVLAAGSDAEVAVLIGPSTPSLAELRALEAEDSRVQLHIDEPDVCTLMAESDLAVGAAGTTSWERCCLGLPTIVLVLAPNQSFIARNLGESGAARLVEAEKPASLTAAVQHLANDSAERLAMSEAAAAICDGEGAARVAGQIANRIHIARTGSE